MRILFTTTGGLGHFHPLVPVAQAAEAAGHAVAFACPQSFVPAVEGSGFEALVGRELSPEPDPEIMALMQKLPTLPEREANALYYQKIFVELTPRRSVGVLLNDVCPAFRPDVIVREGFEYAATIVAEKLGVPQATIQAGFEPHPYDLEGGLASGLDALRKEWGLPADPHLKQLYPHLLLSHAPPSYQDPRTLAIPTLRSLQTVIFDRSGDEVLPDWVDDSLARPVVYITLGTEMTRLPGVYPDLFLEIIGGIRDRAGTIIVSVGRSMDPSGLGPQPPHVHVERYVPQSLLLPYCDLIVTHGGHNTVLAALHAGLPLLITPITADQPDNARHCEAIRVARVAEGLALTADRVAELVGELLTEPQYGLNARRVQEEMGALPGVEEGVRLLEEIAGL